MQRAGRWDYSLCRAGLTANDEVVATKIKLLQRQRHERKIGLIIPDSARQSADKRSLNAVGFNDRRDSLRVIDMGKNISLWKHFA